jgi:hypothetical protein
MQKNSVKCFGFINSTDIVEISRFLEIEKEAVTFKD